MVFRCESLQSHFSTSDPDGFPRVGSTQAGKTSLLFKQSVLRVKRRCSLGKDGGTPGVFSMDFRFDVGLILKSYL